MRRNALNRLLPLALLTLVACTTNSPTGTPVSGGAPADAEASASGTAPVPTEQVRDDIARPATKTNDVLSREWEGLGSTGGGTGTGVDIGTTASPPDADAPR